MSQNTLGQKVWDAHLVRELPTGQHQLFIGLHLIHEVTSPQAFAMLRERKLKVMYPRRSFATIDHIIPTDSERAGTWKDAEAESMRKTLEQNVKEFGIKYFSTDTGRQGIVHVIGPELGLIHPGMITACGDSHTSTHGAFGSVAFGVGTKQVMDILATQCLAMDPLKVRRINVEGKLNHGVFAKDVILYIISKLGVKGGLGFMYEYAGNLIDTSSMEERMSICNMSIEGGARAGYVNPDDTTFEYLEGREYAPKGSDFHRIVEDVWRPIGSGPEAVYDDEVSYNGEDIPPMITWGINPGQAMGIRDYLPREGDMSPKDWELALEAMEHMKWQEGQQIYGEKIDVAFIGSCTNGRLDDLREGAKVLKGRKVAPGVRALAVPGSQQVDKQAKAEGLDIIYTDAGFRWGEPGCSMCLAMNPDKLQDGELCASSSNRNFKGRQGNPTGRTLLMSPVMVASSSIEGKVADPRDHYQGD